MKNKIITNKIKQSQEYKKTRNLALKYTRLNRRILRKLIGCMEDIVVRRYGQVMIIRVEWDGINAKVLFLHRDDNNEDNTFEVTINVNGYVTVIADEILYYQIVHKETLGVIEDEAHIDVKYNYENINEHLENTMNNLSGVYTSIFTNTTEVLEALEVEGEWLKEKIKHLSCRDVDYRLDNIELIQIHEQERIEELLIDEKFDNWKMFAGINRVA